MEKLTTVVSWKYEMDIKSQTSNPSPTPEFGFVHNTAPIFTSYSYLQREPKPPAWQLISWSGLQQYLMCYKQCLIFPNHDNILSISRQVPRIYFNLQSNTCQRCIQVHRELKIKGKIKKKALSDSITQMFQIKHPAYSQEGQKKKKKAKPS